jgi:hypothetical protein
VKLGGEYFFFMGEPQTQRNLPSAAQLSAWTKTSQRHEGLMQCHLSPVFMFMMSVFLSTVGCWDRR